MSRRAFRSLRLCALISSLAGAAMLPAETGPMPSDTPLACPDATILLDFPGARLRVDGREPAPADTGLVVLPPGTHRFSLYLPPRDGLWRPPILDRPISVAAGETILIDRAAVLTIHVTSLPDGAEVRVAGAAAGATPCLVSLLRRNARETTLARPGYRTAAIPIGADGEAGPPPIRIRLEPIGEGRSVAERPGTGAAWLPWATFSAFAASTAAGFYCRQRADDLYDRYLRTASAERRDDDYDRAATWDDRARIFWVGGQVALGASVWLLLRRIRRGETDHGRGVDLSLDPGGPHGEASIRLAWTWEVP